MPRRSAAVDVSVGAIRTLPSRSSRLRTAVSSWSLAVATAAAAAAAGPSPCRSWAVVLLPPRLRCVAGAAASLRLESSPATSRLTRPLPAGVKARAGVKACSSAIAGRPPRSAVAQPSVDIFI